MNQPSSQLASLKAAVQDFRLGHYTQAVSRLLDLYEEGYLSDKLGEILSLLPDDLTQTSPTLLPRLEALISAAAPPSSPSWGGFDLLDFDFDQEIEESLEQWSSPQEAKEEGEEFLSAAPSSHDSGDGSMPWFISADQAEQASLPPALEPSEEMGTMEYGLDPFFSEPKELPPKVSRPTLDFGSSFGEDLHQPSALSRTTENEVVPMTATAVSSTQENTKDANVQEILDTERAIGQARYAPSLAHAEDPVTREVTGIEELMGTFMDDPFDSEEDRSEDAAAREIAPPARSAPPVKRPEFDFSFSFGEESDPPPSSKNPTLPAVAAAQDSDEFYNPFELSEASGDIPQNWSQESWGEPIDVMPGLSEDWLDEAAPAPQKKPDQHADVTAIPGLTTSGAGSLFDVAYGSNTFSEKSQGPSSRRYAPPQAESSPQGTSKPGHQPAPGATEPDYDLELLDAFTFDDAHRNQLPISSSLDQVHSSLAHHSAGDEVSEEEFFELAASLAAEHSSSSAAIAQPSTPAYRGEPIVRREQPTTEMPAVHRVAESMPLRKTSPFPDLLHRPPKSPFSSPASPSPFKHEEPTNPFAHNEATGVQGVALERGPSSFVTDTPESTPDGKSLLEQFDEQLSHHHIAQAQAILAEMSQTFGETSQEVSQAKTRIQKTQSEDRVGELGDLSQIPVLKLSLDELSSQALDHKAGFLLSQIDGMIPLQDLLEISGMPRHMALEALAELVELGIIGLT